MRLISLYANNFKKLKIIKPISFPEGIILISGLNESGKSTLLDAILYALFGRMIRPRAMPSNDDILAYGTDKSTVILRFSIEDRTFEVKREIFRKSPNKAGLVEVFSDGVQKLLASGHRSVTSEIEKLLGGITFDEIVASNVVAQKDLNHLVEQSGSDRKKVINVFLNLESFNKVLEKLGEERKELGGTQTRPGRITIERDKLSQIKRELDEFNKNKEELSRKTQESEGLKVDLTDLSKERSDTEFLFQNLTVYDNALIEKEKLTTEIKGEEELKENMKKQLAELNLKQEELEKTTNALVEYAGMDGTSRELSNVAKMLESLKSLEIQKEALAGQMKQKEAEVESHEKLIPRGLDTEQELRELDELRRKRPSIRPYAIGTGVCVIATIVSYILITNILWILPLVILDLILFLLLARVLSRVSKFVNLQGKYDTYISEQQVVTSLRMDISKAEVGLKELAEQASTAEQDINRICQSIGRYSGIYSENAAYGARVVGQLMLDQLRKDELNKERLENRLTDLSKDLSKRIGIEKQLKGEEVKTEGLRKAIGEIKFPDLPSGIGFSKGLLKEVRDKRDTLNRKHSSLTTLLDENGKRIQALTEYIREHKDVERRYSDQEKTLADLNHRLSIVTEALKGIEETAKALRTRVKPNVERYMGMILPTITSNRYKAVRLDEQYNLEAYDPEAGEYRAKEVFSGGTEDQFLLSMRLAFALALLPEVKGRHPEFLFLDEPLSSSDEIRRSGIMELLSSDLSENFRQIFIISHVGGLEEEVQSIIRLEDGSIVG